MGVTTTASTLLGGVTPICSECHSAMCWDLSEEEYEAAKEFWDAWTCRDCNPEYKGALTAWLENKRR